MSGWMKKHLVGIAVGSFIIALFMPLIIYYFYTFPYPSTYDGKLGVDNIGSTGDFIAGTMIPGLTIAAFFLLLKGYFMQQEEFKQNRQEMAVSATALKDQLEVMLIEKEETEKKSELEIFFLLLQNWRNLNSNIKLKSTCYYNLSPSGDKKIVRYFVDQPKVYSILEYGEHIKYLVDISTEGKSINWVAELDGRKGNTELELIKNNLENNLDIFYRGFNNIMEYISDSKYNKEIMFNTLRSCLYNSEIYLLCLIASNFVLGAREVGSEREKLNNNLDILNIKMYNCYENLKLKDLIKK